MICPSQKIPKNIDSRCTCNGLWRHGGLAAPPTHWKGDHGVGAAFITDLTLSKRRLNEGIDKTLHNRAFVYYHKRTILP